MNRLTLVLAIIASGLILLLFNSSSGKVFGIPNDDFASLVSFTAIGAVMASGLFANRTRLGPALKMLLVWLVIILGLASLYVYKSDLLTAFDRIASGIIPGRVSVVTGSDGKAVVTLSKNSRGHFTARVTVNGRELDVLVDTGASDVALTFEDAEALGLDPEHLAFTRLVNTANGSTFYAPVTLDSVMLGPLVRNAIPASVALKGNLDQSLLGMSFLSTLGSLEMSQDSLKLRD